MNFEELGFVPDQPINTNQTTKPQDNFADLGFEENKPLETTSTNPNENTKPDMEMIDQINAFGGGVATGLAKTGRSIGGLLTDPLPESIQKPIRSIGQSVYNIISPESNPESIPAQAIKENPTTATIGEVIGRVAPYAIPGIGASNAANIGLGALAGAAESDDGVWNRLKGASIGAGTTGILIKSGQLAQTGISALRSSQAYKTIQKYVADKVGALSKTLKGSPREIAAQSAANVYNVTRQTDDELFNAFRQAPGNYTSDIRQVKRTAEDLLDSAGENMSGSMKQVLNRTIKQSDSATSLADLHDIQKFLASQRKTFYNQDGQVFLDDFTNLQKTVATKMEDIAKKAGVTEEYNTALKHYKEKLLPLINAGTDDVANALSDVGRQTNPSQAAKILDTWVDNNIKKNAPNETKAFLNTLDPVGRNALELRFLERGIEKTANQANPGTALRKMFKEYGLTTNELLSGENKQVMNGAIRILDEAQPFTSNKLRRGDLINLPVNAGIGLIKNLLDNPMGTAVLKVIGDPSLPRSTVNSFIKQGSSIGAANLLNPNSEE